MIRLGAIGDVIRTLPAASAVRAGYPDARITWLVEPPSRSGVEGQPWIDEVLVFPRPQLRDAIRRGRWIEATRHLRGFLTELRGSRFDLVLDFHAILKSGLLAWASGARARVTYARPYGRELAWLFAPHRARLSARHASRFDRNLALVHLLDPGLRPAAAPFRLDPALGEEVGKRLGAGPAPIAIHPGTSPATPHKRWPLDRFAAVARALQGDGIPSVVTAGPGADEQQAARELVAASEGAARLAPATPSLAHLAALLSRCRLYVGGDTGPMHVASLVGTPVVQLLGPTDPVENAPYPDTPSRTVRVAIGCNPCRRGCAAATCIRAVPAAAVIQAARELLA